MATHTQPLIRLASLTMSALVLVGCGTEASSTQPRRPAPSKAPAAVAPLPPAAEPGQDKAADLAALVAGIRHTQQTVKGFTGQVVTFEDGPKGKGTETIQVAFKKPSTLKLTITQSSGDAKGTQLLWTGGDDCKVKPGFLPFPVSIRMDDDRLLGKNGWEIRETEVSSILNVLLAPASRLTILGDQMYDGKPLTMVEVVSPLTPKGGAKEIIGINRQTNMPGVRMIHNAQGKLIYRLTIKQLVVKMPTMQDLAI